MAKRKMPKRTNNDLLSTSEKIIVLEYKLRTGYYKKIIETDVKHPQLLSFYLSQHIIYVTSLHQFYLYTSIFNVLTSYDIKWDEWIIVFVCMFHAVYYYFNSYSISEHGRVIVM
jgi:hypothetical protein